MDRFLWAFGSMIIVMLILFFMPLCLTKKGKSLVTFAGFLLASGGLAALSSFSIWITALMLLVLIFFVTFLMDTRLGPILYEPEDSDESISSEDTAKKEIAASQNHVNLKKEELEEIPVQHLPAVKSLDQTDFSTATPANANEEKELDVIDELPEYIEEEASFLSAHDLKDDESGMGDLSTGDEKGYLSEIEAMLAESMAEMEDPVDKKEPVPINQVEDQEDDVLPVLSFEDKPVKKSEKHKEAEAEEMDEEEIPVIQFDDEGGRKHENQSTND